MSALQRYLKLADAPAEMAGWLNAENIRADVWLTWFLASTFAHDPRSVLTRRATLTIFRGPRPALVARFIHNNDPVEISFTPDGQTWRPDLSTEPLVGVSWAVPLILLALCEGADPDAGVGALL